MSEGEELETLVYCLGQIGGKHNPVITSGSAFDSKHEYTSKGYARFIKEAKNIVKYMNRVIGYFLESVKSEFEEDPLAFIDSESEEDLKASIQKMTKQWKEMFKEHQKKLRALKNRTLKESSNPPTPSIDDYSSTPTPSIDESSNTPTPSIDESSNTPTHSVEESSKHADEDSSEETSSSSAKVPKLDPEATPEATAKTSEPERYFFSKPTTELESDATSYATTVGVPVENLEFPKSVFLQRLKEFGGVLKKEYQQLRMKMGKALDRISPDQNAHDLKGFTFQKMEKFAKWKYAIKTLNHMIPELESKLGALDLDFEKRKKNEKRLTDWMYFDDGKRDRKYHHRLLITMELTGSIEEISAIIWKQLRRYGRLKQSLENKLPEEYGAFKEKREHWIYEVLYNQPMKKPVVIQTSNESDGTYFGCEEIEEDA